MIKICGFVGIESYDLILLMAQSLKVIGVDVILTDLSFDKSLFYAIPDGGSSPVIDFCGLHYFDESALSHCNQDSYLIVYFGTNFKSPLLQQCNDLFIVSDCQKHHVARLQHFTVPESVYPFLVIHDKLSSKISAQYLMTELANLEVANEDVIVIEDNAQDLENRICLQYNDNKIVRKVSPQIISFITTALKGDFGMDKIKSAVKGLRR